MRCAPRQLIFIHFGIAHLLFKSAVSLDFAPHQARRSICLLVLTLPIAVPGNVVQFMLKLALSFGWLSGVAYGLFAYVVVRRRLDRAPAWQLHLSFSRGVVILPRRRHSAANAGCLHCEPRALGRPYGRGMAAAAGRPTRAGSADAV